MVDGLSNVRSSKNENCIQDKFTVKRGQGRPNIIQAGNANTSGQDRQLVETEGQKASTGNCCKRLSKSVIMANRGTAQRPNGLTQGKIFICIELNILK